MASVLGTVALSMLIAAASATVAASQEDSDQQVADEALAALLPNASAELTDEPTYDGARRLTIRLAEAVGPLGRDSTAAEFTRRARLAWLSQLAAGAAIARSRRLSSYAVIDSTGQVLPDGAGWGGTLRYDRDSDPWARLTRLGTLPADDARAQIDANLSVLRSGVPDGLLHSADATILQIGNVREMYAIAVELSVTDLQAFQPYLGDAIFGLGSGLTGADDTLVEGFATHIRDDQGREAGGWNSVRAGHGNLIGTPCQLRITMTFTSQTSAPAKPLGSGSSCGGGPTTTGPPLTLQNGRQTNRLAPVGSADCISRRCVKTWPRLARRCLPARSGTRLSVTTREPATAVLVETYRPRALRRGTRRGARAVFATPQRGGTRWSWRTTTPSSTAIVRITVTYANRRPATYFARLHQRAC